MDLEDKNLKRSSTPIVEFSGEIFQAEGKVILLVTIIDELGFTIIVPQELYVIDAPTRYNYILGRKFTPAITRTLSTHQQTLLFVGQDGRVGRARVNHGMARSYNLINKKSAGSRKEKEPEKAVEKEDKRPSKKSKLVASSSGSGEQNKLK